MTKSTITRERLEEIRDCCWMDDLGLSMYELSELASMALAAMDSEPNRNPVLAYADSYRDMAKQGVELVPIWGVITDLERNIAPLYRHAQQPVVPDRSIFEKWWESQNGAPLDGWDSLRATDGYCDDGIDGQFEAWNACRAAMLQELQKSAGDAGDVQISRGCRTNENVQDLQAGKPPVVPVQLTDEQIDAVLDSNGNMAYVIADKRERLRMFAREILRAAMLLAQSDDDGEPTDDERIMAIEGIHNCERCGDEGWVVGEMGITRCMCGQAGNSPVIGIDLATGADRTVEVRYVAPPGYVMVPKEPTERMVIDGFESNLMKHSVNLRCGRHFRR